MILNVAESTANTMLDSVAARLEGDWNCNGRWRTARRARLLDPGAALDRELIFKLEDGVAIQSGEAAFARAVAADGSEFFPASW